MKYKGFEIRDTVRTVPTSTKPHTTNGIYSGERLIATAESVAVAKRAIDAHTQSGIWKKGDSENG